MKRFFATIALCLLASQASAAVNVTGLYNTGVDNSGTALPVGTTDGHYALTFIFNPTPDPLPANAPVSMTPHPVWLDPSAPALTPDARWIGPVDGPEVDPQYPLAIFSYKLNFTIGADVDLSFLEVSGQWASDNQSEIWLNGLSTGISRPAGSYEGGDGSYVSLLGFVLPSGLLVHGLNVLEFRVSNDDIPGGPPDYLNPTGLLVANLAAVAVPEPGSIVVWSLLSGALIGGVWIRKRQTAV